MKKHQPPSTQGVVCWPEVQLMWFVGHFGFQILLHYLRIQFQFHLAAMANYHPGWWLVSFPIYSHHFKKTHTCVVKMCMKDEVKLSQEGICWLREFEMSLEGFVNVCRMFFLPNRHLRTGPLIDLPKKQSNWSFCALGKTGKREVLLKTRNYYLFLFSRGDYIQSFNLGFSGCTTKVSNHGKTSLL